MCLSKNLIALVKLLAIGYEASMPLLNLIAPSHVHCPELTTEDKSIEKNSVTSKV